MKCERCGMKVDYSANARRLCDLLFGRILCPEHAGLELGIILEGRNLST